VFIFFEILHAVTMLIETIRPSRKIMLCIMLVFLACLGAFGQENENAPLSLVFHDFGWNALHSVTYNYGLNFVGAGLGTWGFIGSGVDWKWRNLAYENEWMPKSGMPFVYVGYVVPGVTPVAAYVTGLLIQDKKLQITGLALTQSLALTLGIQTVFKIVTGRALPGIVTGLDHTRTSRADDFSGEFNWFNLNFIGGWPSGHTATAFSAAATVSEIYHDNLAVQIGVWTYAALMGLGVSVSVHWASDVFAGALIGYAIGKTAGRSFRKLWEENDDNKPSLYVTGNAVGIIIRF
jgi:membrane-associated phospholipid phosphatase